MCILLPFSLVGGIISNKMVSQEKDSQRVYELSVLEELAAELDNVLEQARQFTNTCQGNANISRILNNRGKSKDYLALADFFEEEFNQNDYWFAAGIGDGEKIVFQRGDKYLNDEMDPAQMERLENETSFWTGAQKAEYWEYGKLQQEQVITLYSNIYNVYRNSRMGEVFVCLSEEKLRIRYLSYLPEDGRDSMIINEKGEVISSRWKRDLGKNKGYLETILQQEDQESGYFRIRWRDTDAWLYYVRCQNGWYLISIMENSGTNSGIIFMLVSVGVCLVFGMTYAWIQNRYIIAPLKRLSIRMNRVKWGEMEQSSLPSNEDEIGSIIRNFEDMMDKINHLVNQVYLEKIKTQEAEREGLLTQMKPHFLYNTLDSIHWTAIRNRDYEVGRQLEALSDIFKHVLNFGKETLCIQEELDLAQSYFYLVKKRYSVPVELEISVEEELKEAEIPKLIVQPLVENAIVHGLEEKENGGKILVRVRKRIKNREQLVEITVADNGLGTYHARVRAWMRSESDPSNAFALRNIDERVRLTSGENCGLRFYSRKGAGTIVKVLLRCSEQTEKQMRISP